MLEISKDWQDYECIATGNGQKLERWGKIILNRPDPQIIWPKTNKEIWNKSDANYIRSNKGGGHWEYVKNIPEKWTIKYKDLTFKISPTNFKHTGIFPEQATNWDYIIKKIQEFKKNNDGPMRILNLFAYTGAATMAASFAKADEVVHVDASKGMVEWAKENMKLSNLENNYIRFIVDDVIKFLEKEKRRGRTYHGIIMDPPSFGHGPNKELWRLEDNIEELLQKSKDILDDNFSFLLINSYTTGLSSISLKNILTLIFPNTDIITGEIGLPVSENSLVLPCGIYGKITKN